MISLHSRGVVVLLKIYVAIALTIATILSPLALSFIPVLLIAGYLYLWRWPVTATVNLLTEYFTFFAIAILLAPAVGPFFSPLISLPVLLLINHALLETAGLLTYRDSRYWHRPTNIYLALLLIAILLLVVSGLLASSSLLLAGIIIIGYFAILGMIAVRQLPLPPVTVPQLKQRMVAGTEAHLDIKLTPQTKVGGLLFVESPYEWLKVSPDTLSLKENKLLIRVSLLPPLSGPTLVTLKGQVTDRWGLIRTSFELEVIRLYVIPRARYAAWLARKYLSETKAGTLPLIANVAALKPIHGLRSGVEYYGSRLYQSGDSLKNIDWKHSLKYDELVSKEFAEFHGRSAIVLINLAAGNAEEADKLAGKIITTAISLARENIPAALAVYDHEGVKITTTALQPRPLLLRSVQVAEEMVTFINPVKYLNPPDVSRLRANISRLQLTGSKAAGVLAQLLQLEYQSLDNNARLNPATKALQETFKKVDRQANIIIISPRNHDAEAIAFNTFRFARKGNAVISV